MTDLAIKVENLSKQYKIGELHRGTSNKRSYLFTNGRPPFCLTNGAYALSGDKTVHMMWRSQITIEEAENGT